MSRITSSELRTGNLVLLNKKPFRITLQSLYEGIVNDIEPIPLTRKVFMGISFKRQRENDYGLDEKLYLTEAFHLNSNKWFLAIYSTYGEEVLIGEPFEFLHQLQNAFFVLKKQELKINL